MNFHNKRQNKKEVNLLPTRQQLATFLQSKRISAAKLKQMTAWEQIQLTKEYQQAGECCAAKTELAEVDGSAT